MRSADVRRKFIEFYRARGHVVIPSAPLVPENDPTTLFTGSGMQPMLPFLLGQTHPEGTRIVDSQKCFRAGDIDEVGDNRHTTFFEMLGNWSLGDYFKIEQIEWTWMFLTDQDVGLGLDPRRLYVSVFAGKPDIEVPKDEEAMALWVKQFKKSDVDAIVVDEAEKHGLGDGRIFYYNEKKNWWSRAGATAEMPIGEPGGPDSEVFFDFGEERKLHERSPWKDQPCHPNCDCGRFLEICNSVFMAYRKTERGFIPLERKNIDFGGGLERLVAATDNNPDIFRSDLFLNIIKEVEQLTDKSFEDPSFQSSMRIIADHFKGAVFLIAEGLVPSNKTQGYFLRRLLRRTAVKMRQLSEKIIPSAGYREIVGTVMRTYDEVGYFDLTRDVDRVSAVVDEEIGKFSKTLERGLKELRRLDHIDGTSAFNLYQSYGFPLEITMELVRQQGLTVDRKEFQSEFEKHKELSRTASKGMFRGGLADHSEQVTKLHTATHLLHAALRKFLGDHVQQKGNNITVERLRFDFTHPSKLTKEERQSIEQWVNEQIRKNLSVSMKTVTFEEAKDEGALAFFGERYGNNVNVYSIGDEKTGIVSKEVCGGPHVAVTAQVGQFHLGKEEAVGAGVRRLYATLS